MKPTDMSLVDAKTMEARDLRRAALELARQAETIEKEAQADTDKEFIARANGVVTVVCYDCAGTSVWDGEECCACEGKGYSYAVQWTGPQQYDRRFVEDPEMFKSVLLAETWKTADGVELRPCDFEDGHLVNTVKYIRKRGFALGRPRIYDLLLLELKERELDITASYNTVEDQVQHDIDEL